MSGAKFDADVIILGGGSGGLAAAFRAASHGAKVTLLEPAELGGTCVNAGCVPKKAMWLAADLSERMQLAADLGFDVPPPNLDWPAFVAHRQRYVENIRVSYRKRLDEAGILTLPARGHFVDRHTVECTDGIRYTAKHIVVATGGRPVRPQIPGGELGLVSDDFFNLCAAPERVAIVGGGYIAVELSGILQALGSHVELLVRGERLLDGFDRELSEQLSENNRQRGVHAQFGKKLDRLERRDAGLHVVSKDGTDAGPFNDVIFAIGRQPNTDALQLGNAGLAVDEDGALPVDDFQQTAVDNIHAIGDVTGRIALTPVAIMAGKRLMDRLFGDDPAARLDYDLVPTVVFAHPPMGMIGLTEEAARKQHGDQVRIHHTRFRPMLLALAESQQRSLFKLVCVGEEERVVGIHLLGDGADEILQGFAVAMKLGLHKRDLDDTVAIHPTSAEEVVLMR